MEVGLSYKECKDKLNLKTDSLDDFLFLILGDEFRIMNQYLSNLKILNFITWKKRLKNSLFKEYIYEGLYPSILFLSYLALVLIYKFSFSLSISNLINDLNPALNELNKINRIVNAHCFFLIFITLFALIATYTLSKNDLRVLLFIKMHNLNCFSQIKMTWTYLFVLYYRLLYTEGLDTQSIFTLLSKLNLPLPVSWLAYHLEDSFSKGNNWNIDYLDDVFLLKIQQCLNYEEVLKCLDSYVLFAEKQINNKFHKLIKIMKGGICLLIISIIKIYYQSLYLPLQIIQTL